MKTFDEALDGLIRYQPGTDFTQAQFGFESDVMANDCVTMMASCVATRHIEAFNADNLIDVPDLLRSVYLNGLILGVAIGVRMEKAE